MRRRSALAAQHLPTAIHRARAVDINARDCIKQPLSLCRMTRRATYRRPTPAIVRESAATHAAADNCVQALVGIRLILDPGERTPAHHASSSAREQDSSGRASTFANGASAGIAAIPASPLPRTLQHTVSS